MNKELATQSRKDRSRLGSFLRNMLPSRDLYRLQTSAHMAEQIQTDPIVRRRAGGAGNLK